MGDTSGEVSMASSEGSCAENMTTSIRCPGSNLSSFFKNGARLGLLQNHHKTTKHPCGSSFWKAKHFTNCVFKSVSFLARLCGLRKRHYRVSPIEQGRGALVISLELLLSSAFSAWRFYSLLNQHLLVRCSAFC